MFIDLTKDLENLVSGGYSDARGPVIRGAHTELTLVQFEAGEGARSHTHQSEQFVVVVEGRIRFVVGDQTYDVGPGQAGYIAPNVPHETTALERSRALSFKNLAATVYDATTVVR